MALKIAGIDAVQAEKRILGAFQDLEYSVLGKRKVYSSCKEASEAATSPRVILLNEKCAIPAIFKMCFGRIHLAVVLQKSQHSA